jgi:hypothetical protein
MRSCAIVLFVLAATHCVSLFAQQTSTTACYVWDFARRDGGKDSITLDYTKLFERKLTECGNCIVLERRLYNRLIAHEDNERAILDLKGISGKTRDSLQFYQATAVIFGEVWDDVDGGRIEVSASIQWFTGRKIVRSVSLDRGLRLYSIAREAKIGQLVDLICDSLAASNPSQKRMGINVLFGVGDGLGSFSHGPDATASEVSFGFGPTSCAVVEPFLKVSELLTALVDLRFTWNKAENIRGKSYGVPFAIPGKTLWGFWFMVGGEAVFPLARSWKGMMGIVTGAVFDKEMTAVEPIGPYEAQASVFGAWSFAWSFSVGVSCESLLAFPVLVQYRYLGAEASRSAFATDGRPDHRTLNSNGLDHDRSFNSLNIGVSFPF